MRDGWSGGEVMTMASSLSWSPSCERSLRLAEPQMTMRSSAMRSYRC
jgi:hypothetical protein